MLEHIQSPANLRGVAPCEWQGVADDVRGHLIDLCSRPGGVSARGWAW